MEDDSLDDFFSKKDKSKKKSKNSKYTSSDILKQRGAKSKKSKSSSSFQPEGSPSAGCGESKRKGNKDAEESGPTYSVTSTGAVGSNCEEDDQWEDFKEEAETDYSGLRIQNLQISSRVEEEEQANEVDEEGEEGDGGEKKTVQQGPWAGAVPTPTPAPPPPSEELQRVKKEEPKTGGKYIPPGARQAAMLLNNSTGTELGWSGRRAGKKEAPNLQSEIDFPTLGGATHPELQKLERDKTGGQFEAVRSGNRQEIDRSANSYIELGNKFDALRGGSQY